MDTLIANSPVAQEVASKIITAISEIPPVGAVHIGLAVCGALLYNLIRLDRLRKEDKKFRFLTWLHENYISLIISAVSIVVMFWLRGELKDIMGFDMSNRFGCFWAGFTAHTLISEMKGVAAKKGIDKDAAPPDAPTP